MTGENFRYVFKPRPTGAGRTGAGRHTPPPAGLGASGGGVPMGRRLPAGRDTNVGLPVGKGPSSLAQMILARPNGVNPAARPDPAGGDLDEEPHRYLSGQVAGSGVPG